MMTFLMLLMGDAKGGKENSCWNHLRLLHSLAQGHMSIIQQAESENDRVILGVTGYDMDRGRDFIPYLRRVLLMRAVYEGCPKITLSEVDDRSIGLTGTFSLSAWEAWCEELFYNAGFLPDGPHCEYHWYIGERNYIEKIQALYPDHQFHLMDRTVIPVSGTAIRENPGDYWEYIHPVFQQYLTQNGHV